MSCSRVNFVASVLRDQLPSAHGTVTPSHRSLVSTNRHQPSTSWHGSLHQGGKRGERPLGETKKEMKDEREVIKEWEWRRRLWMTEDGMGGNGGRLRGYNGLKREV